MVTCCLCFNPIFDQPAGCLTKVLVCENRTDDEPHALCWICVLNLKKNSGKKNEWFLSCPICRNDCFFSEDTIADTGKMSVGVCDECKGDMDEFGPRMKSFTNTCISCKVKKCDVLPAHETFVENYEAFGTAPIVSSRSLLEDDYKGETENGQRHGWGVCESKSGDSYEGEWKDDLRCGRGVLVWQNGDRHEGEWKDGKPNGHGTKNYASGSTFVGEWKHGKRNGKGKFEWTDGETYVGEWKNGERHGQGTNSKKTFTYSGEWKNGVMSGLGVGFWKKGDKYNGEWKDNKRWGHGVQMFSDGVKHEGEWENNEMHGKGVMTNKRKFTWRGEWNQGEMCKSTMLHIWPNGTNYLGEWKDDEMHGEGTMWWEKDDLFKIECGWKKGKPHGKGRVIKCNGHSCEARWWNGMLVGGYINGVKLLFFDQN
jgi:hypothetical protein